MWEFAKLWATGFCHRTAMSKENARVLFESAQLVRAIPGDLAELGIFRGGMTKMLAVDNTHKTVWGLDTFNGIPEDESMSGGHRVGDFACGYPDVQRYVEDQPNIRLVVGQFPASVTKELAENTYSLVHLDADIYQATKDGLQFFWPRLSRGGIILLHDYEWRRCPGVKGAVDEFLTSNPGPIETQVIGKEDSSINPCIMKQFLIRKPKD